MACSVKFYKKINLLVAEDLANMCNHVIQRGLIPQNWLETHIIVLPKKGKDPAKVESYRPISF